MGSISNQISHSFFSRYGVELNSLQGEIRASEPGFDPAAKPKEHLPDLEQQKSPPPRAARTEISRLMLNLSRETYSTTAVDDLLYIKNGGEASKLAEEDRKALQELAESAANALAKINGLTVHDILDDKGSSKIEELFGQAADLQFQLGNMLRELSSSEKYEGDKFGAFRKMLDDISLKCDSRGSEIMTLYCEVKDYGEKKQASQIGGDYVFQKAKVEDLVKGMAGSMHGNDRVQRFEEQIKSIEESLKNFSTGAEDPMKALNSLFDATQKLTEELMKPAVAQSMDKDIHAALTEHLGNLRAKMDDRVGLAVEAAEKNVLKQCGEMNRLGKKITAFISACKGKFPCLNTLMSSLSQLEREGLKDVGVFDKIEKCLTKDLKSLETEITKYRSLRSKPELAALSDPDDWQVVNLLEQIGYTPKLAGVIGMAKRTVGELRIRRQELKELKTGETGGLRRLSGEDVVNAFRREVSMPLSARVHGADEDLLDPQLCDRNLVEKSRLGSGNANTVYKLTYKMDDGSLKDYVFKPDLAARAGLKSMQLGKMSTYQDFQQVVKLNAATSDVADFLGLGRLVGKNHVTVHNGQYGLLMEKAPGKSGIGIIDAPSEYTEQFSSISVVSKLAKELNDLRWLDIATGQGDRHNDNYLIDFGEDGMPKVTAIDNDASFMPYMVGVGKYNVKHNDERFKVFQGELYKHCRDKNCYPEIMEKIKKNGYVIDVKNATKEEICAIFTAFGIQAFSLPKQMSRSLCDKLLRLSDEDIQALGAKLAKNVGGSAGADATVKRLQELKEIAQTYNSEGKIINDLVWKIDTKDVGVKSAMEKIMKSVVEKEMERPDLQMGFSKKEVDEWAEYQMSSTLSRCFGALIPKTLLE